MRFLHGCAPRGLTVKIVLAARCGEGAARSLRLLRKCGVCIITAWRRLFGRRPQAIIII